MKKCTRCGQNKEENCFRLNVKKKLGSQCIECHRQYVRDHYEKNKQYYKDKAEKRRRELTIWFDEYKSRLKCVECGESHPALIDFHHVNSDDKDIELSKVVNRGWSVSRIIKEVNKCMVLCCKCHRLLHYNAKSGPWIWRKNVPVA